MAGIDTASTPTRPGSKDEEWDDETRAILAERLKTIDEDEKHAEPWPVVRERILRNSSNRARTDHLIILPDPQQQGNGVEKYLRLPASAISDAGDSTTRPRVIRWSNRRDRRDEQESLRSGCAKAPASDLPQTASTGGIDSPQ